MIVVLAHGFPGFSTLPIIGDYFRGIRDYLLTNFRDLQVLAPQVAAFEDVQVRAPQLAAALPSGEKVHIVAHSGGGLDARYVASPAGLNLSSRIASITTISSPHGGTAIANALAGPVSASAVLATSLGPLAAAVRQYTSAPMTRFNAEIVDASGVAYSSYAGVIDRAHALGTPFSFSWFLIDKEEGPNDGWISVASARHGNFLGTVPLNHLQEIGQGFAAPVELFDPPFDYKAFYGRIVANLGGVAR